MAYNNGFPMNYTQYYPNTYVTPQRSEIQQGGIIWVQGEAGAKSYLVAPNNTVQLWDSESQTIYLKSADASGMPSMKILDYSVRSQQANQPLATEAKVGYVTQEEFSGIKAELNRLKDELDRFMEERHESNHNQ